MLGAEESVMLPLLELALESSDVTILSVSSCLSGCAWLAMLPKTTGSFKPHSVSLKQASARLYGFLLLSVESCRHMGGPATETSDQLYWGNDGNTVEYTLTFNT